MTITEFLLAQIAKDVETAWQIHDMGCDAVRPTPFPCTCGHEARVLADCEAKRRIVELCRPQYAIVYRESDRLLASAFDSATVPVVGSSDAMWPFGGAEDILRALAAVYADHDDFDPAWRL